MIQIKDKVECSGCTACYNICPVNAIKMNEDNEGFKYPVVDTEKCINCGLCDKICPIKNKFHMGENNKKPKVIASWSIDNNIRNNSTSGGVFSELAKVIYNEKGYVCGAVFNENNLVEHFISNEINDLEKIRSSKYLQSELNDIFKKIKKLLENGNKVLFCGSSCQVAGLYSFLSKKEYENLYTCDFVCRGMNSPKIFKKYLKSLEKKYKSNVKSIKFRYKKDGWHNSVTRVTFENGREYFGNMDTDSFMMGFLHYNSFMRPSCYDCKFKSFPRPADITLGDFWGIDNISPKLDDNKGISMILINSKKGSELFDGIKEHINFEEVIIDEPFKYNLCTIESVEMTDSRKMVSENIDKMGYEELSRKFFPSPSCEEKIRIKIYNIKKKIKKIIKPIYKRIFRKN